MPYRQATSVAGKSGCMAHVMCRIVQRGGLGMARDENDCPAQQGDKQDRQRCRDRFGLCRRGRHHSLPAVTPDGLRSFRCLAGLLTRGSQRTFHLPSPTGPVVFRKAAIRLQSRGRLRLERPHSRFSPDILRYPSTKPVSFGPVAMAGQGLSYPGMRAMALVRSEPKGRASVNVPSGEAA
jgi:hypothetical protein